MCGSRAKPEALHATRIASGEADALIGCDLIVAAGDECLSKLKPATRAVIDADLIPTSEFARNPDWSVDREAMIERLTSGLGDHALVLDAQRLARDLLGDSIAANTFMLGAAWQRGLLPITHAAIERAIELNGVAIDGNKLAFEWGRRAAHDLAGVEALIAGGEPKPEPPATLEALIERRSDHLSEAYGAARARRYRALVDRVRAAERSVGLGEDADRGGRAVLSPAPRRQGRMGGLAPALVARVPRRRSRASSTATTRSTSTSAPGRSAEPIPAPA